MGQHNNFKNDMEILSEMYSNGVIGGGFQQTGGIAQQAAGHMRDEDGEDKTGHLSDEDLLDKVVNKGTAGDRLIDAARAQIKAHGSLTPHERDALARDAYEGEEDTDEADAGPEAERRESEDVTAARQGFDGPPAIPAH
jgi:hypothetical protein